MSTPVNLLADRSSVLVNLVKEIYSFIHSLCLPLIYVHSSFTIKVLSFRCCLSSVNPLTFRSNQRYLWNHRYKLRANQDPACGWCARCFVILSRRGPHSQNSLWESTHIQLMLNLLCLWSILQFISASRQSDRQDVTSDSLAWSPSITLWLALIRRWYPTGSRRGEVWSRNGGCRLLLSVSPISIHLN